LFWLTVASFALVWVRLWLPWSLLGEATWPEGALLALAAAATLASLACQLPVQNVLLAAVAISSVGSLGLVFGRRVGIPVGPSHYAAGFGQELPGCLPWPLPVIWLVAALNARGVARLIVRPERGTPNCGFWVIGLSTLLLALFGFGLDEFATQARHYWFWAAGDDHAEWRGAPLTGLVCWAALGSLVLVLAAPALLNKRPAPMPADYQPLMLWLLASVLFATGAATRRLWGGTVGMALSGLVVLVLGLRSGGKRRVGSAVSSQ
jgi:uncharacterized membrane protein